jgi:hypothetical protein
MCPGFFCLFSEKENEMMRFASLAHGLTCSFLLLAVSGASAQERREEPRREVRAGAHVRRATDVIGGTVVLRDNASLGKIDDIVLSEDGYVEYLVVAYQDKFILVPWSAGKFDFDKRTVVLEIEKDRFRDVPTFTREKWPDVSDTRYVESVYKFYGVKPTRRDRREERREERREKPE